MFFYASPMQAIWPSILSRNVGHPPQNTPWKVFYLNLNGCNGCLKRIYFWDGICWCMLMTERSEHFVFTIRFFFLCWAKHVICTTFCYVFILLQHRLEKLQRSDVQLSERLFFISYKSKGREKLYSGMKYKNKFFFFSLWNNFFFSLIYQKKNFLKIWTIPIQSW